MNSKLPLFDDAAFRAWIADELRPRAREKQIRARHFDQTMAEARLLPEVLDRQSNLRAQALPIWDYLDISASDERARIGRQMLRRHRGLLNRIEQAYGVEPEVIAAIWGLESGYGIVRGTTPVISALVTHVYCGRRARYFEDELIAALRLTQRQKIPPADLVGSAAGALGHGQFMPSSILEFGVDFDGDGKAMVWADDPTDALASIANFLEKHLWTKGQPWGFEVTLPDGFDHALSGTDRVLPSRDWAALGVTVATGGRLPDYGPASVLLPAGARGAALLVLRNFHVLTAINHAESHAIALGHLSDRIGGGKAFRHGWPRNDRLMTPEDIRAAQLLLTAVGFDPDGIDGLLGPMTIRAVRAYQIEQGLLADGYLTDTLLAHLRGALI